jgi:hypothetical protein
MGSGSIYVGVQYSVTSRRAIGTPTFVSHTHGNESKSKTQCGQGSVTSVSVAKHRAQNRFVIIEDADQTLALSQAVITIAVAR